MISEGVPASQPDVPVESACLVCGLVGTLLGGGSWVLGAFLGMGEGPWVPVRPWLLGCWFLRGDGMALAIFLGIGFLCEGPHFHRQLATRVSLVM